VVSFPLKPWIIFSILPSVPHAPPTPFSSVTITT
jgi:hypothetical protein